MNRTDGCRLFGAHQALAGIRGSVILFHSVMGCHYGSMNLRTGHFEEGISQSCTVIGNKEVIFGGEDSVRRALTVILQDGTVKTVFLVTGCVSELIHDDVEAVAREFSKDLEILVVHAPGFDGGAREGYEAAIAALTPLLPDVKKKDPGHPAKVNILGLGADDYCAGGDLSALRELFGEQALVHAAPPFCSTDDLRRMGEADLTLVFGRGKSLAEHLNKEYGIPWEELPYPYGITGIKRLYRSLEAHCGCDYSREEEKLSGELADQIRCLYPYLTNFYQKKAAVYTEASRAKGLKAFLEEELGMQVVWEASREEELDEKAIDASEAVILFGSTWERKFCRERHMPLIRTGYPVPDRAALPSDTQIGVRGTASLIKTMINETLELWSGTDGALL